MNPILSISRNALALVGIAAAIVLVVLAGILIMGSAAIHALMVPGMKVDDVSTLALLVTIIVLLLAVLTILILLFWCCCKKNAPTGKEGELPQNLLPVLIPALPFLEQLPNLLNSLGLAVYEAGMALQWTNDRVESMKTAFSSMAADAVGAAKLPIPQATWVGGVPQFPAIFAPMGGEIKSLEALTVSLSQAVTDLTSITTFPVNFQPSSPTNLVNVDMAMIASNLRIAGKTLAKTAHAMGATPQPPAELLQP